jgi:hypothetical protein
MASENYRNFALASLDSTEGVADLPDKVGLLIIAEAWLELAEQTPRKFWRPGVRRTLSWWVTKPKKPIG